MRKLHFLNALVLLLLCLTFSFICSAEIEATEEEFFQTIETPSSTYTVFCDDTNEQYSSGMMDQQGKIIAEPCYYIVETPLSYVLSDSHHAWGLFR